jgi:hypothetical protein
MCVEFRVEKLKEKDFGKHRYGESDVQNDLKKYDQGQGMFISGRQEQNFLL